MKLNKLILSVAAGALMLYSCDDQKMDWGKPDGHGDVTISEIPLELAEKLANYDYIKAYATKHMPGAIIGIGLGADIYINDEEYKKVADDNFQMITMGNAMKHASVVTNSGAFNFTTIDNLFAAIPDDMKVYGHALAWHTQQRASYLNGLIAPEVIIETDPTDDIENVIDNFDFETGNITGWNSWGNSSSRSISAQGEGYNSDYALVLINPTDANDYSAQAVYTLPSILEQGETYIIRFMAKSNAASGSLRIFMQNESGGSQMYGPTQIVGTSWIQYEWEIEMTQSDIKRIVVNFGKVAGAYYIDDFKFGKKKEIATNYCTNGSFESGTEGWSLTNKGTFMDVVELADAPEGTRVMKMTASPTSSAAYNLQIVASNLPVLAGKAQISFYIKADQTGKGRLSFGGMSNNYPYMDWLGTGSSTESFAVGTTWQKITVIPQNFGSNFVEGGTTWSIAFDFGYLPDVTYYLDDIQVTDVVEASAAISTFGITYVEKTDAEKKEIITDAMETWIKTMMDHCKHRVVMWDVLNEPITDGGQIRGVEYTPADSDLGEQEFYWGKYMGKDYAVKAFQFARQYSNATDKLFINDYNLEVSPSKLAKLIEYVNYIDQTNGSAIVDGIGTQMHVIASSITREEIDNMFKTIAATGKLVRVTELDVRINTTTPTTDQLARQAEVYQWVAESYRENVPQSQQSGITIWSLTDAAREHEYWFPDDAPNLFDKNYGRKHAYKGFCDGLAGYDISTDFTGSDWVTGKE